MLQNELLSQIENSQPLIIIDVRSGFEYQHGHIPGALHIPFWMVFFNKKLAGMNKASAMVLYCEHGPRAVLAKLLLSCLGFKNISCLTGHMMSWRKAGLAIEKN